MALRKLAAVAPVIATLALAGPVGGASAAPAVGSPGSLIPCYPYPAFCTSSGQAWFTPPSFWPFASQFQAPPVTPVFGPGPVKLPGF